MAIFSSAIFLKISDLKPIHSSTKMQLQLHDPLLHDSPSWGLEHLLTDTQVVLRSVLGLFSLAKLCLWSKTGFLTVALQCVWKNWVRLRLLPLDQFLLLYNSFVHQELWNSQPSWIGSNICALSPNTPAASVITLLSFQLFMAAQTLSSLTWHCVNERNVCFTTREIRMLSQLLIWEFESFQWSSCPIVAEGGTVYRKVSSLSSPSVHSTKDQRGLCTLWTFLLERLPS